MGLTCPAAIVTLFLLELSSLYQGKLEAFILNATMMITFVALGSLNLSQRRLLKQANSNNFFTLMTSQADWALLTSKIYYFICPQFSIAYSFHFSFKLLSLCKTYNLTIVLNPCRPTCWLGYHSSGKSWTRCLSTVFTRWDFSYRFKYFKNDCHLTEINAPECSQGFCFGNNKVSY